MNDDSKLYEIESMTARVVEDPGNNKLYLIVRPPVETAFFSPGALVEHAGHKVIVKMVRTETGKPLAKFDVKADYLSKWIRAHPADKNLMERIMDNSAPSDLIVVLSLSVTTVSLADDGNYRVVWESKE